jgi:hypothetical protein
LPVFLGRADAGANRYHVAVFHSDRASLVFAPEREPMALRFAVFGHRVGFFFQWIITRERR